MMLLFLFCLYLMGYVMGYRQGGISSQRALANAEHQLAIARSKLRRLKKMAENAPE